MRARSNDEVVLVAYDGLTTLEYAIPTEVFGLERPELDAFYTMAVCAAEPGPIRGAFGITVHTDGALADIARAGTAVVPGWRDRFERPPEPLLDALRACHDGGGRVVSVCSGAFVLASRLHCSPRTFARRFADATGTTPGRWLTERRLARARELLESTDRTVEQIAADVGFGAAVSLRHHFRRTLRTTPTAYRRCYRRTGATA